MSVSQRWVADWFLAFASWVWSRPNLRGSKEPNINDLLAQIGNYPSLTAWFDDLWVSGQAVPHPDYADYAGFPDTYDIGLVILDEPMNVGVYGELPELGQFDYLSTALGKPSQRMVEIVGYGLVGRIPAFEDADVWERRVGYSTIIYAGGSAVSGGQNFVYSNSPGKGNGVGGTCSGDSGGPAFWIDPDSGEPTNLIVASTPTGLLRSAMATTISSALTSLPPSTSSTPICHSKTTSFNEKRVPAGTFFF